MLCIAVYSLGQKPYDHFPIGRTAFTDLIVNGKPLNARTKQESRLFLTSASVGYLNLTSRAGRIEPLPRRCRTICIVTLFQAMKSIGKGWIYASFLVGAISRSDRYNILYVKIDGLFHFYLNFSSRSRLITRITFARFPLLSVYLIDKSRQNRYPFKIDCLIVLYHCLCSFRVQ